MRFSKFKNCIACHWHTADCRLQLYSKLHSHLTSHMSFIIIIIIIIIITLSFSHSMLKTHLFHLSTIEQTAGTSVTSRILTVFAILTLRLSVFRFSPFYKECDSSNANSITFELRTFSTDSKFNECFKRFVVECEFVEKNPCSTTDLIYTDSQGVQTNLFLFLKFNLSHKLQ